MQRAEVVGTTPDMEVLTPEFLTGVRAKAVILSDETPIVDVYCGRIPGTIDGLTVEERRVIEEWEGYLAIMFKSQSGALVDALLVTEGSIQKAKAFRMIQDRYREYAKTGVLPAGGLSIDHQSIEVTVGDLRGLQRERQARDWHLQRPEVKIVAQVFAPDANLGAANKG